MSLKDKILENIKINDDTGCWEWQRSKDTKGYGLTGWEGKLEKAHRMAYQAFVSKIPKGMCVLHKCDNRCCCNPKHLFLGTNKDNVDDRVRKGRSAKRHGENNPSVKLTAAEVAFLKDFLPLRAIPQKRVAEIFGVSNSAINKILLGQTWKHI